MAPTNIGGIHENLGSAEGRELKEHPRRVEVDHNMKQKHATHMQLTAFFVIIRLKYITFDVANMEFWPELEDENYGMRKISICQF